MTPQRASLLLNTRLRDADLRARIGTRYLAGPMPTIRDIAHQFGMSHSAVQAWHIKVAEARREFAA